MDAVRLDSAAAFMAVAGVFLERDEAANNLPLGVAARLAQGGSSPWRRTGEPAFWAVLHGEEPIGAALVTPPHDLVLSLCPRGAPTALAALVRSEDQALPGVTGPVEAADELAAAWCSATGHVASLWRRERIYELRQVAAPERVSGRPRAATGGDLPLLASWFGAFGDEIGEEVDGHRLARHALDQRAALLWVDPEPVSVAAWNRWLPTGVSISPVYTPPELRGHGYASAVTAALSARLLDAGRAFCCLYTDLGNPVSNRIYQRIGYRPVVDVNHYRFEALRRDQDVEPGSAIG